MTAHSIRKTMALNCYPKLEPKLWQFMDCSLIFSSSMAKIAVCISLTSGIAVIKGRYYPKSRIWVISRCEEVCSSAEFLNLWLSPGIERRSPNKHKKLMVVNNLWQVQLTRRKASISRKSVYELFAGNGKRTWGHGIIVLITICLGFTESKIKLGPGGVLGG